MRRNLPGILLACFGLALIAIGFLQGQANQVLSRAIRICMECVGIG